MSEASPVRELRVAVTAPDYDEALAFYRDVLGLREREAFASEDGRVTILEAGRATLELLDATHAAFVDEVEVGRRVAGHIRLAFEVDDSAQTTRALQEAGATVIAVLSATSKAIRMCPATRRPTSTSSTNAACVGSSSSSVARPASRIVTRPSSEANASRSRSPSTSR